MSSGTQTVEWAHWWGVEPLPVGMDDQGNNKNWYYVEIFFFFSFRENKVCYCDNLYYLKFYSFNQESQNLIWLNGLNDPKLKK